MKTIYRMLAFAWIIFQTFNAAQTNVKIVPDYMVQCTLDTITLHVDVENVTDLFAFSITVKYDNSLLKLTNRMDGTFLEGGGDPVYYEHFPSIVNAYDSIIVDASVLGTAGVTGSGRLFSLKFVPLAGDTSVVKISSMSLRNSLNQNISATKDSAIIIISPSVAVDLTIENQTVIGTDYYFDVYLTRSGTNDLFLASSDFILTFDNSFFTSPVLSMEGASPNGYCTFVPTNSNPANDLAAQTSYFGNTTASIVNSNLIKISISIPTPSDQASFDSQIAKINNSTSTHRLGRFKMTGLVITPGNPGLSWRIISPNQTFVNSFLNISPWCNYLAAINPIDPPDIPITNVKIIPDFTFQCSLDTITLHVDVEDVIDLFAYSITVKYDNSVLKLTKVIEGTFLEGNPGSAPVQYQYFPAIVNAYDSIIVDASILGLAGSTGSGRLFSLKFVPIARDTAVVKIVSLSFRNSLNQEIFAIWDSAIIIIAPPVSVDLTIENQAVIGSDFFFDVYLTRTGANDLYLADADFVLFFNDFAFSSPTLTNVGSSPGFCTFVPTDATAPNIDATRALYYANTTASIVNTGPPFNIWLLKISVNIPTPPDQSTFDATIAKINNSTSTHRLGRFKITGLWLTSDYSNLSWRTFSPYPTFVNTFYNSDPWCNYLAAINPIDPPAIALPVELASFTAKQADNKVELKWVTTSETNNFGFEIQRSIFEANNWNKLEFIPGAGNSNSPKEYLFNDLTLQTSGKYSYRLKQINADGSFGYSGSVNVDFTLIRDYSLNQNYPNPFNPSTTISYSIPKDGFVKVQIFNLLGEKVAALVNEPQPAGEYKIDFNAENINNGIYFYKLEVNDFSAIRKMVVLK